MIWSAIIARERNQRTEKNTYTAMAMVAWVVPLGLCIWWGSDIEEFLMGLLFVFPMTIPFLILSVVSIFGYDRLMWLAFLPILTSAPWIIHAMVTMP